MQRLVSPTGVTFYRSELLASLGVQHGFSTRIGGVSPAPFASLNLGNPMSCPTPDSESNLTENYRRFQEAIGLPGPRAAVHQVHGCAVATVVDRRPSLAQADAIVTGDAQAVVAIRIADCAAVLIASADGSLIAAVHAGWRGTVGGVIPAAVNAMRVEAEKLGLSGASARPWAAAIFPCISFANFEVGAEVVGAFRNAGLIGGPASDGNPLKGRAAVAESCALQLRAAGVGEIDRSEACTFANADDFFSHRRDGGLTGRMALLARPAARQV